MSYEFMKLFAEKQTKSTKKYFPAHEQQFGTFGRPGLPANHHHSNNHQQVRAATMDPRASYRAPMPNSSTMPGQSSSQPRPARSEESISAPIFQPMGPYVKSKRASQVKTKFSNFFCNCLLVIPRSAGKIVILPRLEMHSAM